MNNYLKLKIVNLKNHPVLNEAWVQDRIAEDPSILGIGDIVLKDRERIQSGAGRLDLLFQDIDTLKRYEVEIQLGKLDESHIIRAIEYWDIERKRYPQYEHCAVIIAEDITSRFLNIIQLFNGNIPIIALQMNAIEVDNKTGLIFTKVVDELTYGLIEEDEEVKEVTDRNYWEQRGSKETVKLADEVLDIIKEINTNIGIKYNKPYIGLTENGQAKNFTIFKAKKKYLRMEIRLVKSKEIEEKLENSNLDLMDYSSKNRRYRIRLMREDIEENKELIKEILLLAYNQWNA